MSNYEFIEYSLDNGLARITLNRPKQANAIDLPMAKELVAATQECRDNAAVRAVLLITTS